MKKGRQVTVTLIESNIIVIRGQKVMLDSDLAEMYGGTVKRLNEQVSRNIERFPADFMFRLTSEEEVVLKSQFATSSRGWGENGNHRGHSPSRGLPCSPVF